MDLVALDSCFYCSCAKRNVLGSGAVCGTHCFRHRRPSVSTQAFDQFALDSWHQCRTIESKRCVQLDQACTGTYLGIRILSRRNATASNQWNPAIGELIHPMQDIGGALHQRFAAQSSSFFAMLCRRYLRWTCHGRVGHDQSVHTQPSGHGSHILEVFLRQVRRNFDQKWRWTSYSPSHGVASMKDLLQQGFQLLSTLQCTQSGRVGRRDVHHQIICEPCQSLDSRHVIRSCIFAGLVLAQIDAYQSELVGSLAQPTGQPPVHLFDPFAVESVSIDDGALVHQSKDAWFRISRLRLGCHRSHFHVAKAEVQQSVDGFAILVETSCETDGIGKFTTPKHCAQAFGIRSHLLG
mmetsp:Transcript_11444/g.70303  ORF Transcript_11444/g.70303 Transcript_11444/m.70303 type:complete len:351 (+) Transcript_11444:552-1604(+)